ncbi:MAG: UPF0175 family protein [Candidatus Diapherotrites archaeon]
MGTELISIRLPKEDVKILDERVREERTDRTTALKRIFALGAKQYKLEKAVKEYQAGRVSTGKAAEIAEISLWEMMTELRARNVPNPLGRDEHLQGLKNLEKVWK